MRNLYIIGLRDVLFVSVYFMTVPICLFLPFFGLCAYTIDGVMYVKHFTHGCQAFGSAYWLGAATIMGIFLFHQGKKFIFCRENLMIILFWVQVVISTAVSGRQDVAYYKMIEFTKIFLMAILISPMLDSTYRIRTYMWILIVSVGVWGVKLARYLLATGGWAVRGSPGPRFSFMENANDLALAFVIALPLTFYAANVEKRGWRRWILYILSVFLIMGIKGTGARASFLGVAAVLVCIALGSKRKILHTAIVIGLGLAFHYSTGAYKARMGTIIEYEKDASAMGRIYAWKAGLRMARDHPLTGVGPGCFEKYMGVYVKEETLQGLSLAAHNSFISVAGELGIPGFAIYFLLWWFVFWRMNKVRKQTFNRPDLAWAHWYAKGIQIAIIGYAVNGFFVSREEFDYLYFIVGTSVAIYTLTQQRLART